MNFLLVVFLIEQSHAQETDSIILDSPGRIIKAFQTKLVSLTKNPSLSKRG